MSDDASSTDITPLPADMTGRVQGKGVLYVRSRIAQSAKDLLNEETFLKWYNEDHIPEVVSTSGIKSAFRYVDTNKSTAFDTSKPFLAIDPMSDISFTLTDEFKNINVKSPILPGSGVIYDMADFDVSYLALRQISVSNAGYSEPAKSIITVEVLLPASMNVDEVNGILGQQAHTLSEESGYMRTLIFQSQLSRSNAESRKLKGLDGSAGAEKDREQPSWIVVHEFNGTIGGDVVKKIEMDVSNMDESIGNVHGEVRVWKLEKVFGEGKLFE